MVTFDTASFSEIGNSTYKTPLCPLALSFVVVDFALSVCCFTFLPCIDESTDGLGKIDFKGFASFDFDFFFFAAFCVVCGSKDLILTNFRFALIRFSFSLILDESPSTYRPQ